MKLSLENIEKIVEETSECKLLAVKREKKIYLTLHCNCGETFEVTYDNFKYSSKNKCNSCSLKGFRDKMVVPYEEIEKTVRSAGCVLLTPKDKYKSANETIEVLFECNHIRNVYYGAFKRGSRCKTCAMIVMVNNRRIDGGSVYTIVKEKGFKFIKWVDDYENKDSKFKVRCERGHTFDSTYGMLAHNNSGCPICRESKGEKEIRFILEKFNIKYEMQKRFAECKMKQSLPFDFAIYDTNGNIYCLIEFDGRQHEEAVDYFGGEEALLRTKASDKIKSEFCKKNKIKLVRINHKEFDNIEIILKRNLKLLIKSA